MGPLLLKKRSVLSKDTALLREELSKQMFSDLADIYFLQIQMEVKKGHERDIEDLMLESDQLLLFEQGTNDYGCGQILHNRFRVKSGNES